MANQKYIEEVVVTAKRIKLPDITVKQDMNALIKDDTVSYTHLTLPTIYSV